MAFSIGNSVPSNLIDVLSAVRDMFGAAGDATPFQIGVAYLEDFGVGGAPKVLFVPDREGRMGDPTKMGFEASDVHSCDVHVRADESGDDWERHRKAYDLKDKLVSALKRAGGGFLKFGGKSNDDSPSAFDAFGAGLSFRFTFTRDIAKHADIYRVKASPPDTVAPYAYPPPGTPASSVVLVPTTEAQS